MKSPLLAAPVASATLTTVLINFLLVVRVLEVANR